MIHILLNILPLILSITSISPPSLPTGWRAGILVVDRNSGQTVISERENETFRPASTVKLVTTLLAMTHLGPEYVFLTPLLADTSNGIIYFQGKGAPLLSTEDVARAAMETSLVVDRNITWSLVYDLDYFNESSHCIGWDIIDWSKGYCPPIEALCVGDNLLEIAIYSGSTQASIKFDAYPEMADLIIINRLQTGIIERITTTVEGWESEIPSITLEGTVKPDSFRIIYCPIPGAPVELTNWLVRQLESRGITISGISGGFVPEDTNLVVTATMYSPSMQILLTTMNKWSRNMVAEQILKTVSALENGSPGSTEAGCDMAGTLLSDLLPGNTSFVFADGSGLSRLNMLTPLHLAAVLENGCSSLSWGPEFLATLPVNGRDGTLKTRLSDLPAGSFRGKTGTLNDTCSLAGLLVTSSGREMFVVIMLEISEGQVFRARNWQDEYVRYLYENF